jgi:hypothetical protein
MSESKSDSESMDHGESVLFRECQRGERCAFDQCVYHVLVGVVYM